MPLAVFVHSLTSEFGFYSSAESSIFTLPSIKLSEERIVINLPSELLTQFFVPFAECDKLRFPLARFLVKHFTPQFSGDQYLRLLREHEWVNLAFVVEN